MKCVNSKCEKRNFCEKVHKINGYKIGDDEVIIIPNQFYYELNISNRLAKRGIPSNGFEFGCMKLIEGKDESGLLYINDEFITDFEFGELLDSCNHAFTEMIESGELKLG